MPSPLAEFWKPTEATPGPWRRAATDPPPVPPTEVAWLERRAGEADGRYLRRVQMGALADFTGPQSP